MQIHISMPFYSFLSLKSILWSILCLECHFSPFCVLIALSFRTQLRCVLSLFESFLNSPGVISSIFYAPITQAPQHMWFMPFMVLYSHFSLEGQIISVSPDSPKRSVKSNKNTFHWQSTFIFMCYLNRESTHMNVKERKSI